MLKHKMARPDVGKVKTETRVKRKALQIHIARDHVLAKVNAKA